MNGPTAERAELRAAMAELAAESGPQPNCPDAGVLWECASRAEPSEEQSAVLDHLAGCPWCAQAWEIAAEMSVRVESSAAASTRRRTPRTLMRAVWPLVAAAACLAAAVAAWTVTRVDTPQAPAAFRDAESNWLVAEHADETAVSRDDCVLRWAPGEDGTSYDLLVMDEDLQPIARAWGLGTSEYRLSTEQLEGVPPGGRILWRVTASLPDRRQVRSATFIYVIE